jgi:uroporphyrinogen decarboxylase
MTSRELVLRTLEFKNHNERVPRDLWTLPWAEIHHGEELQQIFADYPPDIVQIPDSRKKYATKPIGYGSLYEIGTSLDEWGVEWVNIQPGLIGEVKNPIIPGEDENWEDLSRVHFPEELLTLDIEEINKFCASTDQFVLSSDYARPFERLQFLRGTENLYCDLALRNPGMISMLERVHEFFCRLLEVWCQTDVDGLFAMDDWGAQQSLLIDPALWVELFKPKYRDYVDIAHIPYPYFSYVFYLTSTLPVIYPQLSKSVDTALVVITAHAHGRVFLHVTYQPSALVPEI